MSSKSDKSRQEPHIRKGSLLLSALVLTPDDGREAFRKRRAADPALDLELLSKARDILDAVAFAVRAKEPSRWAHLERAWEILRHDAARPVLEAEGEGGDAERTRAPASERAPAIEAAPPKPSAAVSAPPASERREPRIGEEAIPASLGPASLGPASLGPASLGPPSLGPAPSSLVAPQLAPGGGAPVAPPRRPGGISPWAHPAPTSTPRVADVPIFDRPPARPHVPRAPVDDEGTTLVPLGAQAAPLPALPFADPVESDASDDEIVDEVTEFALGGGTLSGDGTVMSPLLPFRAPAAPPELTLEQYASLAAERMVHPARDGEILARYGVEKVSALNALDATWERRFLADPTLRARHRALVDQYVAWMRNQAQE